MSLRFVIVLVFGLLLNINFAKAWDFGRYKEIASLENEKKYKQAIDQALEAYRMEEKNEDKVFFLKIASSIYSNKLNDELRSIDLLNEAKSLTPNDEYIYSQLGFDYQAVGSHKQAMLYFAKAYELDPENLDYLISKADAKMQIPDYTGALMDYTEAKILAEKKGDLDIYQKALEGIDKASKAGSGLY